MIKMLVTLLVVFAFATGCSTAASKLTLVEQQSPDAKLAPAEPAPAAACLPPGVPAAALTAEVLQTRPLHMAVEGETETTLAVIVRVRDAAVNGGKDFIVVLDLTGRQFIYDLDPSNHEGSYWVDTAVAVNGRTLRAAHDGACRWKWSADLAPARHAPASPGLRL